MASSILHIKDSYYFEVPKFLWRYHFASREEVPEFLLRAHPHASLQDFEKALNGKILIPQPFGELKNLYEPASGFCISKFMILELVAAIIVASVFIWLARRMRSGERPRGRLWNLFEAMVVFVRDQIARPAIGEHHAGRFLPLLWSLFFFILTCNLMGMLPWLGTPTGAFSVTLGLACVSFCTTIGAGIKELGPIGFWLNMVPKVKLPLLLILFEWLIKVGVLAVEVLGMCIRHTVLGVRLMANMFAGHLVLLGLLGLAVSAAMASLPKWLTIAAASVLGSATFSLLELFVAFLQAYIFVFLSAMFIGLAIHEH